MTECHHHDCSRQATVQFTVNGIDSPKYCDSHGNRVLVGRINEWHDREQEDRIEIVAERL